MNQLISSSQVVTQKGGIKMGPKEYSDIKSKMGKILSDPDEEIDENERRQQQSRGQEKVKQLEMNEVNLFDNLRSFTPSSNTMSIDSHSTKNRFQFNGHMFFSPSAEGQSINSMNFLSKNGSPRNLQPEIIQKPKTVQTYRRRNYSQADPYEGPIQEEEESNVQKRAVLKTSGGQKGEIIESSLLSGKQDVQYIKHLRKVQNKMSFHDHINQLEYDSHINEQCEKRDLFNNRNIVLNMGDKTNKIIVPKKYDHFHVTEGIIPTLLDQTKENKEEQQPSQQTNNNQQDKFSTSQYNFRQSKQKNNSISSISQIIKTNSNIPNNYQHTIPLLSHRSSANSIPASPKNIITTTFSQTLNAGLATINNNQNHHNNNLLTSTQSSFTQRPHTQQGAPKLGLKFQELKQLQDKGSHTKNIISQLLQTSKSKNSIDLKQISRQNSQELTVKIDLANSKPKQVSVDQKNKISKRQEVMNVKKWMDEKLDELIKTNNLNINQIFTYYQNIFQASLSEILRQIGTECKERSQLLQEIWDSQISMSEKIFINISKENYKIEKNSLDEINRLHKHYQFELQKQFQMVDDRNSLISDLKTQLQNALTDSRVYRKKGQKVEKNYKIINNQINQLQEEFNMLFQENLALLMNQNQMDWQTALKQKKKMLEEINLNRKMRNNLLKVGDDIKKERLTMEEQMKKHEVDELVRQFVIDRESNMPVEQGKKEEEEEEDDNENEEHDNNKHVVLKEFWKNQTTDTNDLYTLKCAETNTEKIQRFEMQTQTTRLKYQEIGIQKDTEIEYVDEYLQTETINYNSYCQTDAIETMDIMIQCQIIDQSTLDSQDTIPLQQEQIKSEKKREKSRQKQQPENKKINKIKQKQAAPVKNDATSLDQSLQSINSKDLSIIYTDSANDTEAIRSDEILKQKTKRQKSSYEKGRYDQEQVSETDSFSDSQEQSVSQNSQSLISQKTKPAQSLQQKASSYSKKQSSSSTQRKEETIQNYFMTGLDEVEKKDILSPNNSQTKEVSQSSEQSEDTDRQKVVDKSPSVSIYSADQQKQQTSAIKSNINKLSKFTQKEATKDVQIDEKQIREVKDLIQNQTSLSNSLNLQKVQSFIEQTLIKHQTISNQLQKEKNQIQKYEKLIKDKEEEIKQSKKYQIQLLTKLEKKQKEARSNDRKEHRNSLPRRPSIQTDNDELEQSQNSEQQVLSNKNSLFKRESKNKKQTKEFKRQSYQQQKFSSYLSSASEQDRQVDKAINKISKISSQNQQSQQQQQQQQQSSSSTSIKIHTSPNSNRVSNKKVSQFHNPPQKKDSNTSIQADSQITISNPQIPSEKQHYLASDEVINSSGQQHLDNRQVFTEQAIQQNQEESRLGSKRNLQIQRLNLDFNQSNQRRVSLQSETSTPMSSKNYQGYSVFSGQGQQLSKSPYSTLSIRQRQLNQINSSNSRRNSINAGSNSGGVDSPRMSSLYQNSPLVSQRSPNKAYSINTEVAYQLKKRIESTIDNIRVPKNALKFMPQILKMMNSIISDNFKSLKNSEQILNPLYVQVYEYFLYQFGLRKVAELKMISVIEQCILMQNEYKQINIFMDMYFNDLKSTDMHFFCKIYMLLIENTQQVKVEKSTTNKYKLLTTIPQAFRNVNYQKETLDKLIQFEEEIKENNDNMSDIGGNKDKEVDLLQVGSFTNDMINEFNSIKFDVFEVIHFFITTFQKKKEILGEEYQSVFYAILQNLDKALIDEEGIHFLCMLTNLSDIQINLFMLNFTQKSIMNEMSYDQFILIANDFNYFKTQQILDIYPDKNKTLAEIKEFWSQNKASCDEKIQTSPFYNLYTRNVIEKLDILTQLMDTDQEDPNNQNYLERHKQSFQICYIIVSKICEL